MSGLDSLERARANLREREGAHIDDIHYITAAGEAANGAPDKVVKTCRDWVRQHPEVEGVIWTGLASNWPEKRDRAFSVDDAVRYICELESLKSEAALRISRAREYVRNAPSQIDTAVRCELRKQGWQDAELSSVLFETA